MRYATSIILFLLAFLGFTEELRAQTPGSCDPQGYIRWDGQFANCSSIDIRYEPDPSGVGNTFRFTGRFNAQDGIEGAELRGPVRWYIDGVPIGDSEVNSTAPIGGEKYTILLLDDLQNSATTINDGSQIHVEYLGSERYAGVDISEGPDPGDPQNSIPYVAFKGTGAFSVNSGLYFPLKTYPVWDTRISAVSAEEVNFADTIEIETSWTAPDFDQNVLTGRVLLYENAKLLGAVQIRKSGEDYNPTFRSGTLGLGQHTFDASYVGIEGALRVSSNVSVTVRHPPRPLNLRVLPSFPVAQTGTLSAVEICAFTAEGYPAPVDHHVITVGLTRNDADVIGQESPPVFTSTIEFNANGCAPVDVSILGAGFYSLNGRIDAGQTFLNADVAGAVTIAPAFAPDSVSPDFPPVAGTQDVTLALVAPRSVDPSLLAREDQLELGAEFETVSGGTILQAEVIAATQNSIQPTGGVQLFINGQHVASRSLPEMDAPFVTLGPFDMSEGEYAAVLAYSGDGNFANKIGSAINFTVDQRHRAAFLPQTGLSQEFGGAADAFDLSVSTNVVNAIEGRPTVLTASLTPAPGVPLIRGVPSGTMVLFEGDVELGRTRISGFSGSILLPGGLPVGQSSIRAEYRE